MAAGCSKMAELRLKLGSKKSELINLSYNPRLPTLDDYYHPWTYRYKDLIDAPLGDDQPVARPISMITGEDMDIEAGPNWDDDLSGSPIYASERPESGRPERRREATILRAAATRLFLSPADVQSLSEPELCRRLSVRRDL